MKKSSKQKYKWFLVRGQNGEQPLTHRVRAGSFIGAMRAAFGPADYRILVRVNENECEIRCPFGRGFVVTIEK